MDIAPGWKTYIGAGIAALCSANQFLLASGSPYAIPKDVQDALLAVAISLGLYGLHAQAERLKADSPKSAPPLP